MASKFCEVRNKKKEIVKDSCEFIVESTIQWSRPEAERFYQEHRGRFFYQRLISFMIRCSPMFGYFSWILMQQRPTSGPCHIKTKCSERMAQTHGTDTSGTVRIHRMLCFFFVREFACVHMFASAWAIALVCRQFTGVPICSSSDEPLQSKAKCSREYTSVVRHLRYPKCGPRLWSYLNFLHPPLVTPRWKGDLKKKMEWNYDLCRLPRDSEARDLVLLPWLLCCGSKSGWICSQQAGISIAVVLVSR